MRTALCAAIFLAVAFPLYAQEEPKQITFGEKKDVDPAVSPDGKHLAYSSDRTGSFNIFMITFGTAGDLQLTQGKKDDRHPAWSPDSKKIVFTSKRTGNGDLWVMDADGSNPRQLTTDPAQETQPYWSPENCLYYVREAKQGQSNIFRIKAP